MYDLSINADNELVVAHEGEGNLSVLIGQNEQRLIL